MDRFFHNLITSGRVILETTEAHHFVSVLRGKVGDQIELFDGRGNLAQGQVIVIRKHEITVEIKQIASHSPRQNRRIILATAIAKGQRFDWMLSKCTEIGVDHIALVHFEHSVRLGRESALERYRTITIAAAKQCGRLFLPELSAPVRLIECLADLKKLYPQSRLFYGSLEDLSLSIRQVEDSDADSILFVGPEGGMTELEHQLLKHHGAIGLRIAEHVLRTETAASAMAAVFEALRTNPR